MNPQDAGSTLAVPPHLLEVPGPSACAKRKRLSMNRPFGIPALAGPDRLKAGLQTRGVPTDQFRIPMHGIKAVWAFHKKKILLF